MGGGEWGEGGQQVGGADGAYTGPPITHRGFAYGISMEATEVALVVDRKPLQKICLQSRKTSSKARQRRARLGLSRAG